MPIGISGSGKSRLYKKKYSHIELVSTDLICKEITGSFNYTKDDDIKIRNEFDRRINWCIQNNKSFYFDNCNMDTETRKQFSNQFIGTDIRIVYLVMPVDFDVSLKRIQEDIKNSVERPFVSYSVLMWQFNLYKKSLQTKFEGENVQEIIYLKPEDLD